MMSFGEEDAGAVEDVSRPPAEAEESRRETPARRLVALLGDLGREPAPSIAGTTATSRWTVATALWHPSLLNAAGQIPKLAAVEDPPFPQLGDLFVVSSADAVDVPSDLEGRAEAYEARLVVVAGDRDAVVNEVARALGIEDAASGTEVPVDDFYALGLATWWLGEVTAAMNHADCLDRDSLDREAMEAARAWARGDATATSNHLRASFEKLTEAREKFFPLDAYALDLCLVDPTTPASSLQGEVDAARPVTILASARAIERLAAQDGDILERLLKGVDEGWADVVGGPLDEVELALRPIESVVYQLRAGAMTYRRHLDDRTVETLASRRFGFFTQAPQIARRFGFRFALHLAFDGGKFPIPAASKRLWEGPDGTTLESLTRVPIAADRAQEAVLVPWRLGRTMRDDQVATLPFVHWPGGVEPWFDDLKRLVTYSPVFTRWVTAGDFFHLTDRPYETLRPTAEEYTTPYLDQAVGRRDSRPVTALVERVGDRGRIEAIHALRAFTTLLAPEAAGAPESKDPALEQIEATAEAEGCESGAIEGLEDEARTRFAGALGYGEGEDADELLVVNPSPFPRRVVVPLEGFPDDTAAGGAIVAAQFTEEGVSGVVSVPAGGFVRVGPRRTEGMPVPAAGRLSVSEGDRQLANDLIRLEVDGTTGGVRAVMSAVETSPRLAQQLVVNGLLDAQGQAAPSRMAVDSFQIDYAGPALAQATSTGRILHPADQRPIARFRQRLRVWTGRPIAELRIELSDLDAAWAATLAEGPAWERHLACRWAWPDVNSTVRRLAHLAPSASSGPRLETSEAFEIQARNHRTLVMTGGLAYHRRHSPRMLDTILLAGSEATRVFNFGLVLDVEHPHRAVADWLDPVIAIPVGSTGPQAGWLYRLDCPGVAVTHVQPSTAQDQGQGWGLTFHLLETSGRAVRGKLRLCRNPAWARLIDFNDELIVDLSVDGDSVAIDLTPHELARLDISLG